MPNRILVLNFEARTAPPHPEPTLAPIDEDSEGEKLSPELIQQTVRARYDRFRACFNAGLRRDPHLFGRITTRFVIGADGAVTEASVVERDTWLPDAEALACMVDEFKELTFPPPTNDRVTVVYPIVFCPG